MSDFHFVMPTGVAGGPMGGPVADYNAGGSESDIVCMTKYKTCYFILLLGARTGSTAAPVLTVIPYDVAAGTTSTTAIPFLYKRMSSGETNTAWTSSSSLTVTTGDSQVYCIKVSAQNLPLVSGVKYEYVQLVSTEPANDPQVGALLIMMADARFDEDTLDAVTA